MLNANKKKMSIIDISKHLILILWSCMVLFPIWTMVVNSFKPKMQIFQNPFGFPSSLSFTGYESVTKDGNFFIFFQNSLFVTIISLVIILFIGSMAAYAIANWNNKFSKITYIFFIAGLMIPIRLGTINILQIIKSFGLTDSILGLLPIYIAMGLPVAAFILTEFIRQVPEELMNAAKIDGASCWYIYRSIIIPLIRPALATVAIYNLVPIWNDLWFPLILITKESQKTLILGVTALFGQYQTDWTKILAVLTLASLPVLILYIIMSKQFIKGLTAGALK